jgi:hypothetical protein
MHIYEEGNPSKGDELLHLLSTALHPCCLSLRAQLVGNDKTLG